MKEKIKKEIEETLDWMKDEMEKNIKKIKEELHSCLARLHITEMALNDLIRRLEEDEGKD